MESSFLIQQQKSRYKVKIVAVGKGKVTKSGEVLALDVKVGDTVLFGKFSGTEVPLDGDEVLIMREEDILGVIAA